MPVTINAHQLGRLIDKTIGHMGSEYIEQLHGIRLDADARYLHAVASDRYTMAVARYGLNHDDSDQEPWARTIPAEHLPALREWINSHQGDSWVTIEAGEDRIAFDSARTTYSVAVNRGLEFPDWRGILRKLAESTVEGEPFPCLNSRFFARFGATEGLLRVRLAGNTKAALLFGENFIGAIMPARYEGLEPAKPEPFPSAVNDWLWTLAAGSNDADMDSLPKPDYPRWEASTDVHESGEELLRGVLRSTSNTVATSYDDDSEAWYAHIRSGVSDWMAYRYLDALAKVDPRVAAEVVADTAEELDAGELGEYAWHAAEKAGHDPQKWDDDYSNALRERAAEKPPLWATRFAAGLNAARMAGINFRVEDNPHVTFDAEAEEWKAVLPQPADAAA
ncbi:hypothetical protein [Streptomyces sp. 1222.5]|uniref:hypothetical protein n=1 Tax=Streptomyces sp. 1222.5 TaxID=1881026 RepID=UPI003D730650